MTGQCSTARKLILTAGENVGKHRIFSEFLQISPENVELPWLIAYRKLVISCSEALRLSKQVLFDALAENSIQIWPKVSVKKVTIQCSKM